MIRTRQTVEDSSAGGTLRRQLLLGRLRMRDHLRLLLTRGVGGPPHPRDDSQGLQLLPRPALGEGSAQHGPHLQRRIGPCRHDVGDPAPASAEPDAVLPASVQAPAPGQPTPEVDSLAELIPLIPAGLAEEPP